MAPQPTNAPPAGLLSGRNSADHQLSNKVKIWLTNYLG